MTARAFLLLIAGCFLAVSSTHAQSRSDTARVEQPALRHELLEMAKRDQQVRQALIEKQQSGAQLSSRDVARIDSVDRAHTERMKAIIDTHGWPDQQAVGVDGANAAFLLVQHADRDPTFQKASLVLLREAYAEGLATGQQVALLTDRVLVAEGKPQLYGTQAQIQHGEIIFQPIQDSAHVDKRRAEMGLMPLREYQQRMREMYLQPADAEQEE